MHHWPFVYNFFPLWQVLILVPPITTGGSWICTIVHFLFLFSSVLYHHLSEMRVISPLINSVFPFISTRVPFIGTIVHCLFAFVFFSILSEMKMMCPLISSVFSISDCHQGSLDIYHYPFLVFVFLQFSVITCRRWRWCRLCLTWMSWAQSGRSIE